MIHLSTYFRMTTDSQQPTITSRPIGGLQRTSHWDSPKRQRTLSLSDAAWDLCCQLAMDSRTNRSEVVEIMARWAADQELDLNAIRAQLLA
jgi:hypothetical protein